ncbi:response regulator, partial [Synechocystis sp. LEGE 06083]
DGQDAWEKLKSGLPCDLILCDIEMPRMNGLELLERIQEDANLSRIPVAMITSRGAQKMQRMAAEKGAKGYFVKPYIEETLLEASRRLMKGEVLLDLAALSADE